MSIPSAETTYSLKGKQLKLDSHQDIEKYVEEIKAIKGLTHLDISGNTIGIDASESLSKAILSHKDTLVEVDLSDIYTGRLNTEIPKSLDFLLKSLLNATKLAKLDLSDNAIGLQAIEPLEHYLNNAISLQHLILSNNGMGPYAGARIGNSLYKLSQLKNKSNKPSLKTFVCGRNRLENGSINRLSIGLRNHKDLEVVRLYQNGIRPAGISKLLSEGLIKNSNLKVLDLQDNTITTRASEELVRALPHWKYLTELNLNDCLLKAKGSKNLMDALHSGEVKKELTHLKLQYNELDETSLNVLVRAIGDKLPNLQSLELNGNIFEEDSQYIEQINDLFEERGFGELDELDDLEELDSDEEEEDEEDEGEGQDKLPEIEDLDEVEKNLSAQEDAKVDDLAKELEEVHIK